MDFPENSGNISYVRWHVTEIKICREKSMVCLRPHHGMCLAYFEGKGYSDDFTENMQKMLEFLEKDAMVELTVAGDKICSVCPNLEAGICVSAELVKNYDNKVLKLCGLKAGEQISFRKFVDCVQEKILGSGKREEICGGCQWNEICSRKESRWKK